MWFSFQVSSNTPKELHSWPDFELGSARVFLRTKAVIYPINPVPNWQRSPEANSAPSVA